MVTVSYRDMRERKAFGKWSVFRVFDGLEFYGFSQLSAAPVPVKECFSRVHMILAVEERSSSIRITSLLPIDGRAIITLVLDKLGHRAQISHPGIAGTRHPVPR
jgi:hypothetical protein